MAVSRHPNGACSTLIAALTLCLLSVGTAQAELFWPHSRSWGWDDYGPVRSHHYRSWGWGDYEPFRQRRQRANKDYELGHKPKSLEVVKGPLQIIISIADQKISVYDDGTLLARSSVSTGVQGHPTPVGVFSVIGKELWHRSNIYSAAPMPYMQRITWSGIALHAGVLPGHPASHGCIRLAKDFAVRLWHLTKRGTRVIIAPNNVDPVQIASPRLFSKPKTASSSQESSTDAPAGKDVATIPSTSAALRVQPRPHFPAGPEERNGLASDRNQSPRARISSGPACPDPYKKYPEPPQFDPITACHCCNNLRKNNIDDLLGVLPIEMRVLDRYPVNEFGFDHSEALECLERAQDHRAGQASLIPPAIQRPPQRG